MQRYRHCNEYIHRIWCHNLGLLQHCKPCSFEYAFVPGRSLSHAYQIIRLFVLLYIYILNCQRVSCTKSLLCCKPASHLETYKEFLHQTIILHYLKLTLVITFSSKIIAKFLVTVLAFLGHSSDNQTILFNVTIFRSSIWLKISPAQDTLCSCTVAAYCAGTKGFWIQNSSGFWTRLQSSVKFLFKLSGGFAQYSTLFSFVAFSLTAVKESWNIERKCSWYLHIRVYSESFRTQN